MKSNLLFKKLRNADYLERLRNSMYDTKSKDLSLESSENLEEAELNDKKDYSEYLKDLKDDEQIRTLKGMVMDIYQIMNVKQKEEIYRMRNSISYKLGCMITWTPRIIKRKIHKFIR